MREGQVHPAVVIKIKSDGARGRTGHIRSPRRSGLKSPISIVEVHDRRFLPPADHQVDRTVVVHVACDCADRGMLAADTGLLSGVNKFAAAAIAPENVPKPSAIRWKLEGLRRIVEREIVKTRRIQIEITVVIVVDECEAEREAA